MPSTGTISPILSATVVAIVLATTACATLPPEPPTAESHAMAPAPGGPLAETAAAIQTQLADDDTAFHLLPAAREAMKWRLTLIDSAVQSIDAQYFVWHGDAAGSLLLEHLYAAADRGVKVRLLVDDLHLVSANTLESVDSGLAAVDYHPNLELSLFNPGKYRGGTMGALTSLATDSWGYNRRMHNKMLLVDGHFAIVGGRNVGNEYFGLSAEFNFVDLDVLVSGKVIPEISAAFDQYWNAELVYPAGALAEVTDQQHQAIRRENTEYLERQQKLLAAFSGLDQAKQLENLAESMVTGHASFYTDDPVKRGGENSRLFDLITKVAPPEQDDRDVLYSTPYMIPARNFLELLKADEDAGVRVRLITNSLATNNQPAVHSHYKKYREQFLDMGVELFELHHEPNGPLRHYVDTAPIRSEYIGLHMKAAAIDDDRCFIGTLNFDPRSIDINTEDVLYVESQELCSALSDYMQLIAQPEATWSVTRGEGGDLQWTSFEGTVNRQPARKTSQRLMDSIYRLMPEDQL